MNTKKVFSLIPSILVLVLGVGWSRAGEIVEDFYVPLPEAQILAADDAVVSGNSSTIMTTIAIKVVSDNTVIYYDQWEDGYEVNLNAPTQASTLIWGDGNNAHGIPPGMTNNPLGLKAGTVITLTNVVQAGPRNPSALFYDGEDHIGATKPIVVTRAHWPTSPGTVIAGCVSVLPTVQWGTNYLCPVGQDMTNGLMTYVGVMVQAAYDNTSITITNRGGSGTNLVLNQGQSYLYNGGIKKGAQVLASSPVQADLVIGHVKETYAVDWFTLYPETSFGTNYYTAVGSSSNGFPAYVYLFNPNTNPITVTATTDGGITSVVVPGTNGVTQFTMPVGSGGSFICPTNFYAICTVNAPPGNDTTYNWGFSLVPTEKLTTETDVGWAPGSADLSDNGSPVWVTPLASTTIYVVYGDGTPAYTDSAQGKYSTNYTVAAYESKQVFDPSKNQSGMRLYTLDGTLITAAWGESADASQAGNPYIDAGYTVLPFPVPTLKKSVVNLSNPGQPVSTNGTLLQYTITIANNNLVPLETIALVDANSSNQEYVPNSTTNYSTLFTNPIADNASAPIFPLSSPGYTNALIEANSSVSFTYRFEVTNLTSGLITNLASIPSSVSGLTAGLDAETALPTVTYAAPVINFTTGGTGNGVNTSSYYENTNVFVTVTNTATSNLVSSIQVTVNDPSTGDYETITLLEEGSNTGVYTNGLPTSTTSGGAPDNGTLNAQVGDAITVAYAYNGTSYPSTATIVGPALTKQLYLNQATNGVSITTNGLNRLDPVHYGFGPTLQAGPVTAGWYDNAWKYRQSVTINYTNVPNSDQTNFPVLINSSDAVLTNALANGYDILFTAADGVTELPYERESFTATSSTGTLVAWVNVPRVSHTANTVIYMYYGNASATDQQQAASAWNANYKSVWHLDETAGTTFHDSTSTGNTATSQGTATLGAAGEIDSGVVLNASGSTTTNYLTTTTDYIDPSPYTVSIWFNTPASALKGRKIFGLENVQIGTNAQNGDRMFYVNGSGKLVGGMYDTTANAPNSGRETVTSSATVADGNWHYAVLTYSNTTLTCYLDGLSLGTAIVTNSQIYTTAGYWRMGSYDLSGWPSATNGYLQGSVEEARFSTNANSADWVAAEYTNAIAPAAFYSLGAQEQGSNSVCIFTQTPPLCLPFTMAAGGVLSITNFIAITNGSFAANTNVTASLQTNGVSFLTLTNPIYNSGPGVNTNLVWSATLANSITIAAGQSIGYVVSNHVSGTSFYMKYGSVGDPSKILLPASPGTVIGIQSLTVNSAPYPNGVPASSPTVGNAVFVDVTVSDPFGNDDITSVKLAVTGPGPNAADTFTTTLLNSANVVATTSTNLTFEYKWVTTPDVGNYSILATANEGTEGVTATAVTTLTTQMQDLGSPNTTTFTYGNDGYGTNAYPANSEVCVTVQDVAAVTNPATANIQVPVTITSSAGGSVTVTLVETAADSGYFANCVATTTTAGNANGSTLYAPIGAVLTASYTNLNDQPVNSSATAIIEPAITTNELAVYKTVLSPANGFALTGQPVNYNLQIVNIGSTTLNNVAVTDSFPAELAFAYASLTPTFTNAASAGWTNLVWANLGSFTPGQSTNITVTFTAVNAGGTTNYAWAASGTTTNTVLSYTNSALVTNVTTSLSVAKTLMVPSSTNTVEPIGSNVVFQIAVTNTGTTTITNLPLEDYYSAADLQYTNATIPANAAGNGTLIWTNLAPSGGLLAGKGFTILVTNLVVGQASPAYNEAIADYAVDQYGNAVPPASCTTNVFTAAASLSGYVYYDETTNHSGIYTNIDMPLSGVTVALYTDSNNVPGALVGFTTTSASGSYQFLNLPTNNYLVVETLLAGYAASTASPADLATNISTLTNYANVNFFQYQPNATNYASLSGSVTNLSNWVGDTDNGAVPLGNVTINLLQDLNGSKEATNDDPVVQTTVTSTSGTYSFADVPPGNYVIQEVLPNGYLAAGGSSLNGVVTNGFTGIGLTLTSGQNSVSNNFTVNQLELGGTVFDDANGLTDHLVNGTATNATGAPLYANLLNANSNVLATVAVGTNGVYFFTNLDNGSYLVQLSDNQGTVGSAAPAMALPAGWVNTGESVAGTIAGNTNGLVPVTVATTSVSAVNFGVDALPSGTATNATYLNPGGTNTVLVPDLTGTDPEQGALGGTTNTVEIVSLPGASKGTLYYNGTAVTTGQVITSYNPADLTLNPAFLGAGVVTFNYEIEDAAGEPSASTVAQVTFTGVSLSGTVYDDANGLTDGLVNGVATNDVGVPLYANLLNANSNVLATVAVGTNGAYSFASISSGSDLVQLSDNQGTVGSAAPVMALPAGWVNTGESVGGVLAGNASGLVPVTVVSTSVNNVNFGVAQPITVGGYTWLDINDNGLQDPGEPPLGGVTVVLYQTNGLTHAMTAVATNISSPIGQYLFTNLPPGSYQLQFSPPAGGYTHSPALQGNPSDDSAANATTGFTALRTYSEGATDLTEDAGFEASPTAVSIVPLSAYVSHGEAYVTWQTYDELNLVAFDVTRSVPGGPTVDVTPAPNYVLATGQATGQTYTLPDAGANIPGIYTYTLYGLYSDTSVDKLASVSVQLAATQSSGASVAITSVTVSGGNLIINWTGGQAPYVVQQSTALGAGAVWQVVGPALSGTQMVVPLTNQAGFFRVSSGGN